MLIVLQKSHTTVLAIFFLAYSCVVKIPPQHSKILKAESYRMPLKLTFGHKAANNFRHNFAQHPR